MKKVLGRKHYRVKYVTAKWAHTPHFNEVVMIRDFTSQPPKDHTER